MRQVFFCRAASLAAILAVTPLLAATPCLDEPGFTSLACRVASAVETAGQNGEPLGAIAAAVDRAGAACATGNTRRALSRLRTLRGSLRAAIDAASEDVAAELRIADALRRATASRLEHHPCPELVEVLAPAADENVTGDVFVLVRLAPDVDPATLTGTLDGKRVRLAFDPGQVSQTQAWTQVACTGSGRHTLRVRVAARGGKVHDQEVVRITCNRGGFGLGAEVEALALEDYAPEAIRLTPVRPLRSGATYAVVVTRRLRTTTGRRLAASADFRAAADLRAARRTGTAAHWSATVTDAQNPFPSERLIQLVQSDGAILFPDGFTTRALPSVPRLDGLRAFLRGLDTLSAEHRGFSPSTPVVLQFDAPVELERVSPPDVLFVELRNPGPPGTNLRPLLAALKSERGIAADAVAVATIFAVEDHVGMMDEIRNQLVERAAAAPPTVDFTDPDPADMRRFGVFRPGDPGFAEFFTGAPPASVGAVARGRFLSPDYREAGRFPDRFLDGSATPPLVPVEFLLVVPRDGAAPFPTVIIQHGFCGDHRLVTQYAGDFTAAGLAAIGIPAPEHGPRGNCFDYFVFDDFNAFGNNFRQSSVDLLQLVRLIAAGIDLDGDASSDLRGTGLGYLGISLGGVIGGTFTSIEPLITAAVLNVPGGKLSQIAGAASPLAEPFLASFAVAAGISTRSCGGDPTAAACTDDTTCGGATCLRNPDFTLLLESGALDWQMQLDPGDGAAYARRLRLAPVGGAPRAVLLQEGIGDTILANPLTEALARAFAVEANRPDEATGGVAGLWRFPPPEGHGIFSLPAVRRQAIGFLASGGRSIAAP